jgi:hypothetical protein
MPRRKIKVKKGTGNTTTALLCKLASLTVHVEEAIEADGNWFDYAAVKTLLADSELREWVREMTSLGMAPLKRSQSDAGEKHD